MIPSDSLYRWLDSWTLLGDQIDWGDVPTWATFFGAVAAAIYAARAFGAQRDLIRIELERDEAAHDQYERSRVERVWINIEREPLGPVDEQDDSDGPDLWRHRVTVVNASALPISHVILQSSPNGGSHYPPDGVIGPGQRFVISNEDEVVHRGDDGSHRLPSRTYRVVFTDVHGNLWRRHHEGRLDRIRVRD